MMLMFIDNERKRTRYAHFKVCNKSKQLFLFSSNYIKEQYNLGYDLYIFLKNGYRKSGPTVPHR